MQKTELTIRAVILAIVLAMLLAASNTFLALKIGMLTSASIPAAILSMGILRFFKGSTILENNLVQTAASAGEAVAGGIVYTIPALIIIHYWTHFNYWENLLIALCGGILGVLFSIPLRRVLVKARNLPFPEANAIAKVLEAGSSEKKLGLKELIMGGTVGAILEFAQTGLKVVANSAQIWFSKGSTLFGIGAGFSATLIGAGYLMGFAVGISLLVGAVIAWLILVPLLSTLAHAPINGATSVQSAVSLYSEKIHYIGIGAMLVAGIWTLLNLLKPFFDSLKISWRGLQQTKLTYPVAKQPPTEKDIPSLITMIAIGLLSIVIFFLFMHLFNLQDLAIPSAFFPWFILGSLLYVLIIGFIFAAICGYFSGLVGVSASPGSAVIIAGMLLIAVILRAILTLHGHNLNSTQLLNGAAITIMIGSVITGAAAIANDNIQDLKVGNLIGATPWKQQVMLLIGVIAAAAIIPPIMQLLFNVYGIARVFPHSGMDPTQSLAAPPAAMMAGLAQGVFQHNLPWPMLSIGAAVIALCIIGNFFLKWRNGFNLSILGIAIGIYLPLSTSTPLIIGALIALITRLSLQKHHANNTKKQQRGWLVACGLVAGAALMDVILAIPMALAHNPDVLTIMPAAWSSIATLLGILSVLGLGIWLYRIGYRDGRR